MATLIDLEHTDVDLRGVYDRATNGEEIVIARGHGPHLRLVPQMSSAAPTVERTPGRFRGQVREAPGVWDPMTDEELRRIGLL